MVWTTTSAVTIADFMASAGDSRSRCLHCGATLSTGPLALNTFGPNGGAAAAAAATAAAAAAAATAAAFGEWPDDPKCCWKWGGYVAHTMSAGAVTARIPPRSGCPHPIRQGHAGKHATC